MRNILELCGFVVVLFACGAVIDDYFAVDTSKEDKARITAAYHACEDELAWARNRVWVADLCQRRADALR